MSICGKNIPNFLIKTQVELERKAKAVESGNSRKRAIGGGANYGNALEDRTADDTRNIWRQSLSETNPKPITDFDQERIFRFFPSPDGKNLACIRFTETFDAV